LKRTLKNNVSSICSDVILGLIFMVAAICLSVMVTLNFKPLFYHDISALNIVEESGLSEESIRKNYDILIDYNNFWGADTLEFDGLAMSNEGRIHFEEVKAIFVKIEYAAIIFTIFFAISAVVKLRKKQARFLLFGGIFSVVIPIVVGAFVALNWNWAFITFHHLAFDNDYWIFYPDKDPVITMLPDEFFEHCAIMIIAMTLVLSIISVIVYFVLKKRGKKNVG
jgi:integral membrane protein (TIGR01906 family)